MVKLETKNEELHTSLSMTTAAGMHIATSSLSEVVYLRCRSLVHEALVPEAPISRDPCLSLLPLPRHPRRSFLSHCRNMTAWRSSLWYMLRPQCEACAETVAGGCDATNASGRFLAAMP